MNRLLSCARELRRGARPAAGANPEATDPPGRPEAPSDAAPADAAPAETALSPRERDVARLVLNGKTYREIGEAMFISPRTAEHHIARMRSRLGAATRTELLAKLRLVLDADGGNDGDDGGSAAQTGPR